MAFVRAKREEAPEGEGVYFNLKDYKGQILAFEVIRFEEGRLNRFDEERDSVKANVTVVTGSDRGVLWEGEWIEAQQVVRTLKGEVGNTYVARVGKGTKAYFLNEIDDDEWDDAEALLSGGQTAPKAAAAVSDDTPPY